MTPAGVARRASGGSWRIYKLHALFNRLAMAFLFGNIYNLIITVPPQHGKSDFWSRYVPAYFLGKCPDKRVALISYGNNYARTWGLKAKRVIEDHGQDLFKIGISTDLHKADDWSIRGHEGGMITAGIDGSITGRGADLAIMDDPIKNPKQAFSVAYKQAIWDFWDSTFGSRIHEGARKLVCSTRWAEDDLIGRLLKLHKEGKEHWTHVHLPAIAEEDESFFGFTRKAGEALCPEIYSLKTLEARKKKTAKYWWETIYQGKPFARDGDHFEREWFREVDVLPAEYMKIRSWDLAASTNPNAKRTAGMLMVRSTIDTYCVANAVKGRWKPGKRNKVIKAVAEMDGKDVPILIEQEGGSGGIAQIDELKRILDGWAVYVVIASNEGSKIIRADAFAGQAEIGMVSMKRAGWNEEFLDEATSFPGGPTIDMIDAASNGYNWLADQDPPTDIPENWDPMAGTDQHLFNEQAGMGRMFT